jgi:hypothetical protein
MAMLEQGQTYERAAIEAWFQNPRSFVPGPEGQGYAGVRVCPSTLMHVTQRLTINYALRQTIDNYLIRKDTWDELAMFAVQAPNQSP